MDKDRRALARQLFAIATELIEEAHEAAVIGQSPDLTASTSEKSSRKLQSLSRDLVGLAEAVAVVADTKQRSSR